MIITKKSRTYWRRFFYLLFWGILTAVLVVACTTTNNVNSSGQIDEDCRIVQHRMGETCIPRNPQRVVTLLPEHLASSLALGVRPIGSAFADGFPMLEVFQNKVDKIESVGDLSKPNIEKILLLKPDLIISNSGLKNIYRKLSEIAPTVVLELPYPDLSWKEQLKGLAQILNKQDTYQQSIADYWQRIESFKQALSNRQNIEVSVAGTASGAGIWSYGAKHPVGELLNDLGLERPPMQRGDFYFLENISEEKLSNLDGDILFLTTWGREEDKETREKLSQKPLWQKLKAVREQQVYFVDRYWHNAANILAIDAILDDLEQYLLNASSDS